MQRTTLLVLAHQDDEYFALPWICDERARGNRVVVVYLTDGGSRTPPAVRDQESAAALASLAVEQEDIYFLGSAHRIPDGALIRRLDDAHKTMRTWLATKDLKPSRIFVPDWEGGHPDHDAAYLIALAVAREHSAEGWGFSLYNAFHASRPFFRVLAPLLATRSKRITYDLATAWRYATFCHRYPSQRKTWLGLFPEALLKRISQRSECVNALDEKRTAERPHPGELLYERMFGESYSTVSERAAQFLSSLRY